jgi:hypothetical protein
MAKDKKCEECGERKPDVRKMNDPFTEAQYPEDDDHTVMKLCEACATKRFEES